MNILVVNPCSCKLLRALEAMEKISIGKLIIIGDLKKVMSIITKERIKLTISTDNFIDVNNDDSIVIESKKILNNNIENTILVFGDVLEHYQKKILNIESNIEVNYFYIIDLFELKHFIFISNYSKKKYLDFEDKRKAISSVFNFMKTLGVKKSNCALVSEKNLKSDLLEVNLIRMILKDDMAKNINMINPCTLVDVFNHFSEWNVFNSNINMLIFKNYEVTKTFIDTISIFFGSINNSITNNKIASLCSVNNNIFIDSNGIKDEQDILFSILLLSKYKMINNNVKKKILVSNF